MSKAVLISIRKEHNDKIFAGEKKWKGMKTIPSIVTVDDIINDAVKFYVYEPKNGGGCGKVVGEFICDYAQSSSEWFAQAYCEGTRYMIFIKEPKRYGQPKELSEFYAFLSTKDIKCKYKEQRFRTFDGKPYYRCNLQNCVCEFRRLGWQTDCEGFENTRERHKLTRPPRSWCYVEEI